MADARTIVSGISIALALVCAGWATYEVKHDKSAGAPAQNRPRGPGGSAGAGAVPVITAVAKQRSINVGLEAIGTANSNEAVNITSRTTNVVTAIHFADGEKVKAGQVLVELDREQTTADLAAATAAFEESRSQYNRSRELMATQVLSKAQYEQIEATMKSNQARVAAAQARLSDTYIRAPFTGGVGMRKVSLGALINPGTVITTLDDTTSIKVDFAVPESNVGRLRVGQNVLARTNAYPGRKFTGRVVNIDSRVDAATRAVTVRAVVANGDAALKPGMFLTVALSQDNRAVLTVPEEAVIPEQARQFVYVIDGAVARKREVTLGQREPGFVEVTNGLNVGDHVVIEGTLKLRDGIAVREAGAPPAVADTTGVMTLSDLSIRRPVFATVLSLLLLIVGVMATLRLSLREYPDTSQPVVSVNVAYRGANASVVETRITQILENEVAGLEGVDKVTSQSRDERSSVSVQFTANRDMDSAANDVRDRVTRIMARLPDEADPPQIEKQESGSDPVMFIILTSSTRNGLELTDYADRYLVDRIGAVPGVASVFINGARRYSMRVWLDRGAMAARRVAVSDIEAALRNQNIELPAGRIESLQREFTLRTETSLQSEDDFRNLVIGRGEDGYLVRLGDVAQVQLAAENQRGGSAVDGNPALMMPVTPLSTANVLEVSEAIKKEMALIRETLPKDITFEVNIDNSVFIRESMKKVVTALGETGVIVLVVIFLFLGSLRATLIPAATIPVSILAAAIVMAGLNYSINTLTLLGAVLAIGLVVDDAIVVLENIVRRIEHGEQPLLAAMNGSREITFAVIATTMVLVAVFLPISYLQGNIGKLFGEFGVSVAAAVVFSALVALTLTPMMTSKLFAKGIHRGRLASAVDAGFKSVAGQYNAALRWSLVGARPVWLLSFAGLSAALVLSLLVAGWPWSGMRLPQELAPREDRGRVQVFVVGPEGSTVEYTQRQLAQVAEIARDEVVRGNATRVIQRTGNNNSQASVSTGQIMLPMKEWGERPDTTEQIVQRLRERTQDIPGARVVPQSPGGLGSSGKPVQLVLQGPEYRPLAQLAQKVMDEAGNNPGLANLEMNYEERQPQLQVSVDRDKAADLGVSLVNVARALETMLGSRVVTTFQMGGDEYNVVLQARDDQRASVGDLDNIYVRSDKNGALVPLASVVSTREASAASELRRFNRMRSVTVTANLTAGYPLGEALDYMEKTVHGLAGDFPVQIDYDGESRELKRSSGGLMLTFAFAMLIVYLVLAAQFESFVHPLVILAAVPMALTGALFGLWLFGSSINIFSQIGAVMLVGIASKNGILIVEFANQLRDRGTEFVEATIEASTARLRPVLMTTLATAVGAVPLMVATGAGAESRQSIGATVFFGSVFAVALTLFVVPALYVKIARNTRSPQYLSRLIDRLRGAEGNGPPG